MFDNWHLPDFRRGKYQRGDIVQIINPQKYPNLAGRMAQIIGFEMDRGKKFYKVRCEHENYPEPERFESEDLAFARPERIDYQQEIITNITTGEITLEPRVDIARLPYGRPD